MKSVWKEVIVSHSYLLKVFFLICVLSLSFFELKQKSDTLPYLGDEHDYVSRGVFLHLLSQKDFNNVIWNSYDSYVQEKLPSYYYGFVLHLFRSPLPHILQLAPYPRENSWCQRSEYSEENCLSFTDFWMWSDEHFDNGIAKNSLPPSIEKRLFPIKIARLGSLIVAHLTIVVFFLILNRTFGYPTGILGILLLAFHPLFQTTLLRAMGDGLFILFLLTSIYCSIRWFELDKKSGITGYKWLAYIGITSGLAMSSKLVGLLGVVYFTGLLFQSKIRSKLITLINLGSVFFLTLSVFALFHPFVWKDPIHNILFMFHHRSIETQYWMTIDKVNNLFTVWERIVVLLTQVSKGPIFPFVGTSYGILIYTSIFVIGITKIVYEIFKGNERKRIYSRFFLYWFIITFSIMICYLGLAWDRYYMPFIVSLVAIQAIGGVFVAKNIVKLISNKL